MSIVNTFILVAEDCPAAGSIPPFKAGKPTTARLQYELLTQHPYEYDLNELNFAVHCLMNECEPTQAYKDEFMSRSHPCLRTSPLTRVYGWGVHYDWAGRIAIYPANAMAYQKLIRDPSLTVQRALRNRARGLSSVQVAGDDPTFRPQAFQSVA